MLASAGHTWPGTDRRRRRSQQQPAGGTTIPPPHHAKKGQNAPGGMPTCSLCAAIDRGHSPFRFPVRACYCTERAPLPPCCLGVEEEPCLVPSTSEKREHTRWIKGGAPLESIESGDLHCISASHTLLNAIGRKNRPKRHASRKDKQARTNTKDKTHDNNAK